MTDHQVRARALIVIVEKAGINTPWATDGEDVLCDGCMVADAWGGWN